MCTCKGPTICIDTRQTHANTLVIPSYIHKCFRTHTISFINRNFRTHTVKTNTSTQCRCCDIPNMQHDIHFPPNASDNSLLPRSGYGRSAWRSEDCAAGGIFIESGWWFQSSHALDCRTIHLEPMEIKIQSLNIEPLVPLSWQVWKMIFHLIFLFKGSHFLGSSRLICGGVNPCGCFQK